jgi:starvation-inducible outer membrane lipoprotein
MKHRFTILLAGILAILLVACTTTHEDKKNPRVYALRREQAEEVVKAVMVERYGGGVSKVVNSDGTIAYKVTRRVGLDSDEVTLFAIPVGTSNSSGSILQRRTQYKLRVVRSGTLGISGQWDADELVKVAKQRAEAAEVQGGSF